MAWTLCAVTDENQINTVAQVAQEVWHQHYGDLLGKAQVDYMVEHFQSSPAISRQLREEGYRYYLILVEGEPGGYVGLVPQGDRLFLSKLYLLHRFRGLGIARGILAFLCDLCKREGYQIIWLTVNKHNAGSIAVYEHMGFRTVDSQVADIGGGYVMDDYIMELAVGNPR
jgi:GNAT superfamily N-acetyltransferase